MGASAAAASFIGATVGGAIVGAAAGATIQMGNNLIDGKNLLHDVGKAAIVGAIGGALGGFGGALGQFLANTGRLGAAGLGQTVLKFGLERVFDVAGGIAGNVAVGDPVTLEGILTGVAIAGAVSIAAGSLNSLGKFGGKIQAIQEGSFKAGADFGGAAGTKVAGALGIEPKVSGGSSNAGAGNTAKDDGNTSTNNQADVDNSSSNTAKDDGNTSTNNQTDVDNSSSNTAKDDGNTSSNGQTDADNSSASQGVANDLENSGLRRDYVDNLTPEQQNQVKAALDKWGSGGRDGKNQGVRHILDYAEGTATALGEGENVAAKGNRLQKLTEYTGEGPFSPTDPEVIPKVTDAMDRLVSGTGTLSKTVGDKTLHFIPKSGATPNASGGYSGGQKGIIVIKFDGKYASFMNGDYKGFTKMN
jgi:hypothetical protein